MNLFKIGNRYVQRVKTAHIVTLPHQWVKHWGIHKRSEVEFFLDEEKNLIVKAVPQVRR